MALGKINYKKLFEAGAHFGHKTCFTHPKMYPYLWGKKGRIHLIDVAKTAFLLEYAGKAIKKLAAEGGSILWVGTKDVARKHVEAAARRLRNPYVIHRWIGGTLTNYSQVRKGVTKLLYSREIIEKADPEEHTKKELAVLKKKVEKLEKNVGGLTALRYPPRAIVIVDAMKEKAAVKEATDVGIPIFAIVDSNTDPSPVDFVIPSNDDSEAAIKLIIDYLAEAAAEGYKEYEEKKPEEKEEDKPRRRSRPRGPTSRRRKPRQGTRQASGRTRGSAAARKRGEKTEELPVKKKAAKVPESEKDVEKAKKTVAAEMQAAEKQANAEKKAAEKTEKKEAKPAAKKKEVVQEEASAAGKTEEKKAVRVAEKKEEKGE